MPPKAGLGDFMGQVSGNNQGRRESIPVINPLARTAEEGGATTKSFDIEAPQKVSKWNVVRKDIKEKAAEKTEGLNLSGQRLISTLREQLLDGDGKPNPKKMLLIKALQRKEENDFDGVFDQLGNELFIWMSELFAMLSPGTTSTYYRICTYLFSFVCFGTYLYMLGDYGGSGIDDRRRNETAAERLLSVFTEIGDEGSNIFTAKYLVHWGARYLPRIEERNEDYRWASNVIVHKSVSHMLTNVIMFFALAYHLERKYGWHRVGFIIILAAAGGNFISAVLEGSCKVYVGFSGVCFGLFGLFVADMVLNYETVEKPKTKIVLVTFFLMLMVAQIILEGETSHFSHAGGLVCGLFPSFAFLPNFKSERWEVALPPLGIFTILAVAALPVYVYLQVLPNLDCRAIY